MKAQNLHFTTSIVAAFCLLISLGATAGQKPDAIDAKAAFEKLKGLVGEWKGAESEEGKGETVPITYKLTSHGSVVMETIGPGTPNEMVTLYHIDGDKLVLTHYCGLGNQPIMVMTGKSTPENFDFNFSGGTNMKSKKDMHMHALRIHFDNKDHVETEWDLFQDGKKTGTTKFSLTRKA